MNATISNPDFWATPQNETIREVLAGMDTSLTLREVKVELRRHLLDRWKARGTQNRFGVMFSDQSVPTQA